MILNDIFNLQDSNTYLKIVKIFKTFKTITDQYLDKL